MPSHRSLRLAEAIRETVASAILFKVSDPRVGRVTVLRVEVSGDLRQATAYVSLMGTDAEQRRSMAGLRAATGYLQAQVAARLQIKFTPVLVFKRDDSVKRSVDMSRLIEDTLAADREATARETLGLDPTARPASGSEAVETTADRPAESAVDDDDDAPDDDDDGPADRGVSRGHDRGKTEGSGPA